MKLKTPMPTPSEETSQPTGGAVIAERFKLDAETDASKSPSGTSKVAAMIALLAAISALVFIGLTAALIYVDWNTVAEA